MLRKLRIFLVGYRSLYRSRDQGLFNNFNYTGVKILTSARWGCNSCTVEMKRSWKKPDGESELKIYNSLTKEKV